MKTAFLYAGQGSQKVGMGKDFYETFPLYKETLDHLPEAEHIKEISFFGPPESLSQTINTQPCMVSFAIGVTKLLKEKGISPDVVAGLSLGEYSALAAADVLSTNDTVELVRYRAEVMERSAEGIDSMMLAVLGADTDLLYKVCEESSDAGVVQVANLNCPGQVVLSGERKAVLKAEVLLKEAGVKRTVPVDVSGPFHTKLMKQAGDALKQKCENYIFKEMSIPIVFNVTGDFLQKNETVPYMLEKQVQNSVLFEKTIQTLENFGVDRVIEIGPGKVLSGFVKRMNRNIKSYVVEDVESFENTVKLIQEG